MNHENQIVNNNNITEQKQDQHFTISAVSLCIISVVVSVFVVGYNVRKCFKYVKESVRKEIQSVIITVSPPQAGR